MTQATGYECLDGQETTIGRRCYVQFPWKSLSNRHVQTFSVSKCCRGIKSNKTG